jgi:cell division protein FtsW
MEDSRDKEARKWSLRNILDSIEGDKVIWIVALLLIVISVLVIFSSTPLLTEKSRIEIMKDQGKLAIGGLILIFILYKCITRIGIYRFFSQLGFIVSFALLAILDAHGKLNIGSIRAEYLNGAWRTLNVFGLQLHVFEVVKVAMVMYLAWALHAMKQDQEAMAKGQKSPTFGIANWLSGKKNLGFMKSPLAKRMFYIYIPAVLISGMVLVGSNSSGIFIGGILIGTMLIGGIPFKEIFAAGAALVIMFGACFMIYKVSNGELMDRMSTLEGRLGNKITTEHLDDYVLGSDEFYKALDPLRQPYGAKVAIHEGGLFGKSIGNSTQKYYVTHIYSDYMFSFIIEEAGLMGGIIIMLLYLSLIARCSTIISLCRNEFAKVAIGGLAFLITGQAFLHISVNSGIIPLTGQTLPLLSDGATAFLTSCLAFGIILSISKMVNTKMKQMEQAQLRSSDEIQERLSQLGQIEDEPHL